MRTKYAPHGWYKMRNEKMYEQARRGIKLNSIAEYWKLEPNSVRNILNNEMEKRNVGKL